MSFAMVQVVADLHLHSKYSRAVSPSMMPSVMSSVGKQKGIDLLATGDWTHPLWLRELHSQLEEGGDGIFTLKRPHPDPLATRVLPSLKGRLQGEGNSLPNFLLSVEIA